MASSVINATGRSLSSNTSRGAATSRTSGSSSSIGPGVSYIGSNVEFTPPFNSNSNFNSNYVNNNNSLDYNNFLNLYNMNNKRYDDIAYKYNSLNKLNNRQFNRLLQDYIDNQRNYNYNMFNVMNKYNDSAYQRLVKDLKLAGLNPMLATYNVSPNRVSSAPYSNSIPNFSEFKDERPETDKNNYFADMMNLLITFLNNASRQDLAKLQAQLDKDVYKANKDTDFQYYKDTFNYWPSSADNKDANNLGDSFLEGFTGAGQTFLNNASMLIKKILGNIISINLGR